MESWKLPWDGGCRCGATRIRVTKPPLLTMACHCAGCQKMSASAYSLSIGVSSAGFEIIAGEPVLGGEGRDMHHFCPRCMTWMFTTPPGFDWLVNVRAPVLDDHLWIVPFMEVYTAEGYQWAKTPAPHSFATEPPAEGWKALIDAFAGEGARP